MVEILRDREIWALLEPLGESWIEIDGIRFPVSGIDLSDTYDRASEYEIKPAQMVIARV